MQRVDLLEDVSTVTTLPIFTIRNIFAKLQLCMVHDILEAKINGDGIVTLDIGIGTINVRLNTANDSVDFNFIPSELTERNLVHALRNNESPLITAAESELTMKIKNAYKDLL